VDGVAKHDGLSGGKDPVVDEVEIVEAPLEEVLQSSG
jgi:hypothetical protein